MKLYDPIIGNARRLGLFVSTVTALVFAMYFVTQSKINNNERQLMIRQLGSVLASVKYNNDMLSQVHYLKKAGATGVETAMPYYLAKKGRSIVALVFTVVAPEGYAGPIKLLVGVRPTGEILAVRAIAYQETPGLGDGIDIKKSKWITQFDDQSLRRTPLRDWKVKKDGGAFDQLTGATITPRAVVKAIRTLLVYFHEHRQALLDTSVTGQDP